MNFKHNHIIFTRWQLTVSKRKDLKPRKFEAESYNDPKVTKTAWCIIFLGQLNFALHEFFGTPTASSESDVMETLRKQQIETTQFLEISQLLLEFFLFSQ